MTSPPSFDVIHRMLLTLVNRLDDIWEALETLQGAVYEIQWRNTEDDMSQDEEAGSGSDTDPIESDDPMAVVLPLAAPKRRKCDEQ